MMEKIMKAMFHNIRWLLLLMIGMTLFLVSWPSRRFDDLHRCVGPEDPSLVLSFGTGRLGNQMSTFASLIAYEATYGVRAYVNARQAEVLSSYFQYQSLLLAPMRVIETHYPSGKCTNWKNPFP